MEFIQLESPQYHLPKLRYDFYNSGHQHEPLWYKLLIKEIYFFNDHGFMVYEG